MDCPACSFSTVEREGTAHARLFQCRHDDGKYMIARSAFAAFIALDRSARFAALQFARERSGQAVPVIDFVDILTAQAWRDPFTDTTSVKVVRGHSALAPKAHNDA